MDTSISPQCVNYHREAAAEATAVSDVPSTSQEASVSLPQGGARRPRVWTVFLAFVLATAAILFFTVILAAGVWGSLIALSPDSAHDTESLAIATSEFLTSSAGLVLAAAVSSCTLIGVALLGGALSSQPLRQRLRLTPGPLLVPYLLAVGAGLCLSQALDSIIALQGWQEGSSLELIASTLAQATPLSLAFAFVTIGLMAGVGEELFFRGYVQTRLSARWGGVAGILIASALFGLLHLDPVHAFFAFLFGLYLGWVTERFMSILPAMAIHAINNCASVAQTRFLPPPLAEGTQMTLLAITLGLGIAAFVALRRAPLRRPDPAAS